MTTDNDYQSDRGFTDFPISSEVLKGVLDMGYETATPVQAASIEPALAGRDMVVRAKTGTGKTAAFAIPTIDRMTDGSRVPQALILAPTRELAQQIAAECDKIARYRDLGVVTLVGGLAIGPQANALADGVEIVVGTPGRVKDHMKRGNLDLSTVQTAILDEADEMLSMGFYEDVLSILKACTNEERQVLLFSATISKDTERLIAGQMKDPEQLILSTDADRVEGITHVLYETVPGTHKVRSLLYLLDVEDPTSAIIFCNTREDVATVAAFLDRQGLDVQMLSGELPQGRRSQVMQAIKSGSVRFLVATDVAARGIDISELSHVVNYSLPQDPAVYLHRTGRTGRIGNKGTAINLVGGSDFTVQAILERQYNIAFDKRELPSEEEVVARRVGNQIEILRKELGTIVFESFLPVVAALKEEPDGDNLLAAALRTFFQWRREQRAKETDVDSLGALRNARKEKREGGNDRRKKRKKRRDKSSDRDGDRKHRSDKDDLDALLATDDKPKKKKRRRRRKKRQSDQSPGPSSSSSDGADLDSLLSAE